MAVPEENYGLNETEALKRKACVVGVHRGKNGNWRITVDVEIEVRLPDGRLVTAWEEVKLRGRGEHKPKPDPKWLYEGKRGRARQREVAEPCECRYWPTFEDPVDGINLHHGLCDKPSTSSDTEGARSQAL